MLPVIKTNDWYFLPLSHKHTFGIFEKIYFKVYKFHSAEYISSNSSPSEEPYVKEELSNMSQEDESVVIRYLLDIMRTHDIITEEEYQAVLCKYD